MKLLLVLVGLAVAQKDWLDDFNPESAYLSIISLRRDFETANQTALLNDDEEPSSAESEDTAPSPPPPPPPGRGPRPRPPGPSSDSCGGWGSWEQAKCFWPNESLDKLPPACAAIPTKTEWPDWMKKFVASKAMEKYNMLIDEYKARGAPPKCGYCARSFECRIRNTTTSSRRFCPMKEVRPLFEKDCDDKKACEVSQEKGGCPPPLFLGGGRRQRLQMMIQDGSHEEFSRELFKMRMMDDASEGGRQKRQAQNPAVFGGPASFMPFEPQFDFPYEAKRLGGQTEGAFGPMEYPLGPDNYDGFREGRRGQQGRKRGRGDKRKGERGEGRRGGPGGRRGEPDNEARPNTFVGADEPRFGPPFGRMPPFGGMPPMGRSGMQAPFMQSDDGFPGSPRQPFRPSSFQPGPGEGPRPPFGGEMQFPPRKFFGQGPERRPFPTAPIDDAPFSQFSPMGDSRGPRGGRQVPYFNGRPNPFQPKPEFGPGMSAAPRFSMLMNNRRGMSFTNDAPMPFPRRPFFRPPPPPHHRFLMEIFHGTTCATNGKSCLCCCGHYIPNVDTGACEDLKQLLPGIDKMVENVNKDNQKFQKGPQPVFRQMRQMKKMMSKKFDF